jgi:ubiquinone/menaquinone biosynthesis C-methylase UbiE
MANIPPPRSLTQRLRGIILRQAFTLLYHQFAWAYDWVSRTFFRGQWRTWQRAAIPALAGIPGPAVLEVGLGTGDLQSDLVLAGYVPCGIDLSPAMVRIARRKGRRAGHAPRIARAASQALPFPAGTFDGVVSTFPSEYIFDPRTIAEIARVLRPGGRLVVVPAATLLPVDRTSGLLDRFADLVYGRARPPAPTLEARRRALQQAFAHAPAFGPLVPNLEAAGFQVAVETGTSPTSLVLIVRADKIAHGTPLAATDPGAHNNGSTGVPGEHSE